MNQLVYQVSRYLVFIITTTLLLTGCGGFSLGGANNYLQSTMIEAVADSNLKTPVAIDLVFVNDKTVAPLLSELSGPDWFLNKQAYIKRYDREIDIVSLEVVPLSIVKSVTLPASKQTARNILLFTNYRSKDGQFVAELSHYRQLKIRLLRESYELIEIGG